MRVLVVDNYDSFTFNLVQLVGELGAEPVVYRNDRIDAGRVLALAPDRVLISPGPCTPAEAGASVPIVRAAAGAGIPTLGVCLGHQAIAAAFGGRVVRAPRPVHGQACLVRRLDDPLFAGLPREFPAARYHSLVVDPDALPPELEPLAWSEDGLLMALRHRHRPVWGVQFHPESVLTPPGRRILANFLSPGMGERPAARGADTAASRVLTGRSMIP